MSTYRPKLPSKASLTRGLTTVFGRNGASQALLSVIHRERCLYSSSFPSEIVTCQLGNGRQFQVLCKYAGTDFYTGYGIRGGVGYEAEVYRQILQPFRATVPQFYGLHRDRATRTTWLVLEYFNSSHHITKYRCGLLKAVRWIAQFHAQNARRSKAASLQWLTRYNFEYYIGWARRTSKFAGRLHKHCPWLAPLCERFEEAIPLLLNAQQTIIHGEYYPHNIISQGGEPHAVDWESAAVGPGEIDLVTLTEGFGRTNCRRWVREYERFRWPDGPPAEFMRTLAAAKLYICFRWLGDSKQLTMDPDMRVYLETARAAGKKLEIL